MKTLTQAAEAAKIIRKILKKEYPNVKFKVTSQNYSMGSSVDISWTNGPSDQEISSFTDQFRYGHFNSMEDIYEYSNTKDMPQAKYCMASRTISDDVYNIMFDVVKERFGMYENINDINEWMKGPYTTPRNHIWRILRQIYIIDDFKKETAETIVINSIKG